jgi:hypothetical protein
MRKTVIAFGLLIIAGCKTPSSPAPVSRYDLAIENLSITTEQLEAVQKEKDLFVKVLEDFEQQKDEYRDFLNNSRLRPQMQDFEDWHQDISQREQELAIEHTINVFAAHNQVIKRRLADPNQIKFAGPPPAKP